MNHTYYRQLRELLGLTQAELADAVKVHPQTISKRERGLYPITEEAALAIHLLVYESEDTP